MISRNNLPQSRPNWTNKSRHLSLNLYQATDLIPTTKQLSLFDSTLSTTQHETRSQVESAGPFPLQIGYIPDRNRTAPDRFCKLIHYESNLNIPGQYTHPEAEEILRITRDWDFSLNGLGIPRCRDKLLLLLSSFNRDRADGLKVGGEANA